MTPETRLSTGSTSTGLSDSLRQSGSINGALTMIEGRVRKDPRAFHERWQLFQWLCVVGDWQRALKQLQVASQLTPDFAQTAHVYRDLIRAEVFRLDVFAGRRTPGTLLAAPGWMETLLTALSSMNAGDIPAADASRSLALSEAPESAGKHDESPFAWFTDTDNRVGPACEIVTAGRYAWLPFVQMRRLDLARPAGLLDLLWRPVTVTLIDGSITHGFMPVRYPGSDQGSDAIRLGRETHWTEVGETGVVALGQKTWATDTGDIAMLDVTTLSLDAAHV